MKLKQAEKLWQSYALADMKTNMVGSRYIIERRPHGEGHSYCVSHYVSRTKVAEYWPQWTQDFKATETLEGMEL
jgi:hypothetical protein